MWGFHLNVDGEREVEEESRERSGDWPSIHRAEVSTPSTVSRGLAGVASNVGGHVHNVPFTYSSENLPAGQWVVEGAVESA